MSRHRWIILGVCLLGFMQAHIHRVGFAPLILLGGRRGGRHHVAALFAGLMLVGMVTPFVMVVDLFPAADLIGAASGAVNTFCFVGSLLIPVLVGKILDVSGSFPAAFIACAACEALALVSGAFTRETGLRRRPVMVT